MLARFLLPFCALCGLCGEVTSQDFPRLRTRLPAGSIIYVENMPKAKVVSVQLIASSFGVRETARTHGLRHLLEHLLFKGPEKDIQFRLESHGLFASAETYRDVMVFEIVGKPEKLEIALDALASFLKPLKTGPEEIAKESKVIGEELALASAVKRLSRLAWLKAFGDAGYDALGNVEIMSKSTPAELETLRRRQFAAQNLVLSISGPVDVEATTKLCSALLPKERDPFEPDPFARTATLKEVSAVEDGFVRGAVAPGWNEPETAYLLAAALALSSEIEKSIAVYTPSLQPGLVLVGSEDPNSDLAKWLSGLQPAQIDGLFARGKAMAEDWIQNYFGNSQKNAFLRGLLYSQSVSATPEPFLEHIHAMSLQQFREAVERFRREARP